MVTFFLVVGYLLQSYTSPKGMFAVCMAGSDDTDLAHRVYVVSTPIIALYYTQLIGDAKTLPTLLAAASFEGMAVIGLKNSYVVAGFTMT